MAWPTKTDFVDGDVLTAAQVNNIGTNLNIFNPTSATNGQVLTANGSGSASFVTPTPGGGMTVIASGSMPSAATLTISSIPATYKDLILRIMNWTCNAGGDMSLRLNNSSSTVYANVISYGITSNQTANQAQNAWDVGLQNPLTASTNGVYDFYLPEYATNAAQLCHLAYGYQGDFSGYYQIGDGTLAYTSDIIVNRLDFFIQGGGAVFTGGTYILYGVN